MLMTIFLASSSSCITSGKKFVATPNGGHYENFEISNTGSILRQIWKDRPNLGQKSFYGDDVIDDVIRWLKSRPSIFLYKQNKNIFRDK